jgi:uncharacterized protein
VPPSIADRSFVHRGREFGVTWARTAALALASWTAAIGAVAVTAAQTAGAPAPAASTPSPPTHFVTDGAGFLSASAQDELEARLARYERDTGHQVLLWIGQTTAGEPIEPWAARAFAAWRVGRKGLDDGVAVFVLAADRRVRIEVGYGVEDRLPDAVAARIIGDEMIPRLRAGDRDGAARAGVSGVLAAVGGETGAPRDAARAPASRPEMSWAELIVLGLVGILVLGLLVTNPQLALMLLMTLDSHGSRGGGWGGGSRGGGFGGGWGGGGWGGGGGFSGGGGRSGGGGASGSW